MKKGFRNSGNSVLNSVSLSTALIFFDFFFFQRPLFKILKMKKKIYSFHCPPFTNMKKKKILLNKHWQKWTNSRARNGVMPETMYSMFRCYSIWFHYRHQYHFVSSNLKVTWQLNRPIRELAYFLCFLEESHWRKTGRNPVISILYFFQCLVCCLLWCLVCYFEAGLPSFNLLSCHFFIISFNL